MTDQAKNDAQPVIDAVVVGDAGRLSRALRALATSMPATFALVTRDLLETAQPEFVSNICFGLCHTSDFYRDEGKVFGVTYTNEGVFTQRAGRVGVGLDYEYVKQIVLEVRAEYDQSVLSKALELKQTLDQLDKLLTGHSFADHALISLAQADLFKGHALMVAALK